MMTSTTSRLTLAAIATWLLAVPAGAAGLLDLEAKIPLGEVSGRIDHLAVDLARQRLFVAELGNDTVGIVDLQQKRLLNRITGLHEPQGVAYVAKSDLVFVANGGDGTVHWYKGADFTPAGSIKLGSDADNLRVDLAAGEVIAGYGKGALAILDAATGQKKADIKLAGHPEAFQLAGDKRVFVNVPDAQQIAVIDRAAGRQVTKWGIEARGNFPMAFDEAGHRLLVVYRGPATLAVFDSDKGSPVASLRTCDDADDVFVDKRRNRVYISCGEGVIAVIQEEGATFRELARIQTNSGARTALFVPDLDRLFLAVRARGREPAAVWVFAPK